jgi:hypothetical protein
VASIRSRTRANVPDKPAPYLDPYFDSYLAMKKLRNAVVRYHPFWVFARWSLRNHPNWTLTAAISLAVLVVGMVVFVG